MKPLELLLDIDSISDVRVPVAPLKASCGFTGFPSPAEDYKQSAVSLNEYLHVRPSSTFFFRASGHSMSGLGIQDGDMLIVEPEADPELGDLCVCILEGEHLVKILDRIGGRPALVSANEDYPPVFVEAVQVFGVVTGLSRRFRR